MLGSRRIPLFEREVRVRLSPAALDLLWLNASVLSEGEVVDGYYCGSTMMTIDLARLSSQLSDPCDQAAADALERLLSRDSDTSRSLLARARTLARECAVTRAGVALSAIDSRVRVSRQGRHVHIDIDIEGIATESK